MSSTGRKVMPDSGRAFGAVRTMRLEKEAPECGNARQLNVVVAIAKDIEVRKVMLLSFLAQ